MIKILLRFLILVTTIYYKSCSCSCSDEVSDTVFSTSGLDATPGAPSISKAHSPSEDDLSSKTDPTFGSHPSSGANSPSEVKNNQFPSRNIRLSKHVFPVHYDLLIHPNLTTLTFTGLAKIEIMITQTTSSVILHSKYLNIVKATIQGKSGSMDLDKEVTVLEYPPFEQIAVMTPESLQTGQNYIISIEYSANLSDSFRGFYKSTYKTPEGKVK